MANNLLRDSWTDLDSHELRLLLDKRIGGPGQYDDQSDNPNKLYLPLAGPSCQIALTFRKDKVVAIEPGLAFDACQWERASDEIEKSILAGAMKVGREYSFSSFRVSGSWRGECSGVQILAPPEDAPRAHLELAEHPFILEFPVKASDLWSVTNHRRMREHRRLTHLLNLLLSGRTSLQPRRPEHFWADVSRDHDGQKGMWLPRLRQIFFSWSRRRRNASGTDHEIKWVQQFFFANLGEAVIDELSPPAAEPLEELGPEEYCKVRQDGRGLRVPTYLDDLISCYMALPAEMRAKFDRATFWFYMSTRQWNTSVSASFAALVSSIESLTERGERHQFACPKCGESAQHEVPSGTRRFKDFLDTYAPGGALEKRRREMYPLRSGILHGSELMQLDQDLAFGWDPPWWNEYELHQDLGGLTRVALHNWLKEASAA